MLRTALVELHLCFVLTTLGFQHVGHHHHSHHVFHVVASVLLISSEHRAEHVIDECTLHLTQQHLRSLTKQEQTESFREQVLVVLVLLVQMPSFFLAHHFLWV